MPESRLSRWSRLKQKGGVDDREQKGVEESRVAEKQAVAEAEPESLKLPGGARVRHFVPAMTPLAPDPEDDDDRFTRGIGHVEEDGGEPDVEALKNGPDQYFEHETAATEAPREDENGRLDDIDEDSLTDEQKEIVATLPPLDTLNADSDFAPFMREGVPEIIKRKAMRILWRANPLFGFRDGLNDYDEDFNIVHKIIEEGVGAYKVGRGHLSEEELQKMMPENARRAFDEDEEEEGEEDLNSDEPPSEPADSELAENASEAEDIASDTADAPEEPSEIDESGDVDQGQDQKPKPH